MFQYPVRNFFIDFKDNISSHINWDFLGFMLFLSPVILLLAPILITAIVSAILAIPTVPMGIVIYYVVIFSLIALAMPVIIICALADMDMRTAFLKMKSVIASACGQAYDFCCEAIKVCSSVDLFCSFCARSFSAIKVSLSALAGWFKGLFCVLCGKNENREKYASALMIIEYFIGAVGFIVGCAILSISLLSLFCAVILLIFSNPPVLLTLTVIVVAAVVIAVELWLAELVATLGVFGGVAAAFHKVCDVCRLVSSSLIKVYDKINLFCATRFGSRNGASVTPNGSGADLVLAKEDADRGLVSKEEVVERGVLQLPPQSVDSYPVVQGMPGIPSAGMPAKSCLICFVGDGMKI